MEKLLQAESADAHRQILERFAQDLPISNRTIKGGITLNQNEKNEIKKVF